ncbi:M17 family metallopeptidase [Sulfuritortus calidifontis]|uniref:M17 family metallopeptidase n=1 Tax=Sulfuritortus calidifontis TaxID=1914471 RepID=UPI003B847D2D
MNSLAELVETKKDFSGLKTGVVGHVLHVVIEGAALEKIPASERLLAVLKRKQMKRKELAKSPVTCENEAGGLEAWLMLDAKASAFDRHASLRKALQPLLEEQPTEIHIAVHGPAAARLPAAEAAVYVAWLNGTTLPSYKSKQTAKPLKKIHLHGCQSPDGFARIRALAEGNALARQLTMLPPNELTPRSYRQRVVKLAKAEGWGIEELDVKKLRRLKAGAFLAVARGSQHEDAAIVHLSYTPKRAKAGYALVGKGICFDTGGHNLKPARYMHNMHDDMNGSAVALGLLLAATRLKLPVRLDVWLAIAQNHLSPEAYTQNEVVTAFNGTTIEIVHTDAEGRMVLADTLTLAARAKPAAIIDFATLTGSMAVALGERMSGVLANRDDLALAAVAAGMQCGERVVAFPVPEDYDEALESKVADVKQCTLDGEADHILAARFLNRFVAEAPWLHIDLSASRCKGGLGAVGSDITGFGVALGLGVLERLAG